MSYIHEALKKAQVERDLGKGSHGNLPMPRRKKAFFTTRRTLLLAAFGALVLLAFAGYSWWDQNTEKTDAAPLGRPGVSKGQGKTATGNNRTALRNPSANRLRRQPTPPAPDETAGKRMPRASAVLKAKSRENVAKTYQKARVLHREGSLADAAKWYEKVMSMDPGHVEALNNMGVLYLHGKNYGAARKCFVKAIRLRPGYVDSYYNLACVAAAEGRLQQGLRYLEKAVSMDPQVRDWAQKDSDLDPLRGLPRFREMVVND